MQNLNGGTNVVRLVDVVRNPHTKTPCLIFEFINNTPYKHLYANFSDFDCRFYMYELLRALDFAHSNGVMHRDVKPQVRALLNLAIAVMSQFAESLFLINDLSFDLFGTERDDRPSEEAASSY